MRPRLAVQNTLALELRFDPRVCLLGSWVWAATARPGGRNLRARPWKGFCVKDLTRIFNFEKTINTNLLTKMIAKSVDTRRHEFLRTA